MLLDEGQLLSATELNRNPSRFVAMASQGRRQVILQNNVPVAALVSMEDLRRLDSLDHAPTAIPSLTQALAADAPTETTSGGGGIWTQPPGTTLLGPRAWGPPVTVPLCANHLYMGAADSGLEVAQSAAITGALPANPVEFRVLTRLRVVRLVHSKPEGLPVTQHSMAGKKAIPVLDELDAEIERRNQLLDRYDVNTLDEARAAMAKAGDDECVPDLILVADHVDEYRPRLAHLAANANILGVYVWEFAERSNLFSGSSLQQFRIRVVMRTHTAVDSRAMLGTQDACLLDPGSAMLLDTTQSDPRPVAKFRFTPATTDGDTIPKATDPFLNSEQE